MEAPAEKSAQATAKAEKKAARRAAFIQDIAGAVVAKLADTVSERVRKMPLTQGAGMWLYELSESHKPTTAALAEN